MQHSQIRRYGLVLSIVLTTLFLGNDLYKANRTPPITTELLGYSIVVADPATGTASLPNGARIQMVSAMTATESNETIVAWDSLGRPRNAYQKSRQEFLKHDLQIGKVPGKTVRIHFLTHNLPINRQDAFNENKLMYRWQNTNPFVHSQIVASGHNHINGLERTDFAFDKKTKADTLQCGYRDYTKSSILTQVVQVPWLSRSLGANATISPASSGEEHNDITIALPPSLRPVTQNQFWCEVQSVDGNGNAHTNFSLIVSIEPDTKFLTLPCTTNPPSWNNSAIRVVLTPYRWVEFPNVPLSPKDSHAFPPQSGIPIPPNTKKFLCQPKTEAPSNVQGRLRAHSLTRVSEFPDIHTVIPRRDAILVTSGRDDIDYYYLTDEENQILTVFAPAYWEKTPMKIVATVITRKGKYKYLGSALSSIPTIDPDIREYEWKLDNIGIMDIESFALKAVDEKNKKDAN